MTSGGHLRASHADRERVISVLKAAFVQGLLDKDEFAVRVGQALASRTGAELAAVTADIPAGLAVTAPQRASAGAPGELTMKRAVTRGACLVVATAIAMVVGLVVAVHLDAPAALFAPAIAFFAATAAAVTMIGDAWDQKRGPRA